MKEGTASRTARSVAAHRLEYARIEAPAGDPAADEALTRDVAGDLAPRHTRMHEYLRARTVFFDRAVLTALDAGVQQVVIGGAGYDGRALRYARPDVRWFELDHPATQVDKRERLVRLNLDTGHIRFVAADFSTDPIAGPLIAVGLDPARPTLFLLEGVAAYLERHVLERVLVAFREVAADGSALAISVSTSTDARTRSRFAEHVAALGEPVRSAFTQDQAVVLLAAAGWGVTPGRERPWSAGLLLARAATPSDHPERAVPTASRPTSRPGAPPATAEPSPKTGPLSALLSQALVAFTIEADNEAEHRLPHRTQTYGPSPGAPADAPWLTSLLMWANCLRFLPDEGITLAELRRRARTGTNLDGMGRWGYVTYDPDPGRGKTPRPDAIVRPTAAGSRARDTWRAVTEDVEARWRDRFGAHTIDALHAALAAIVADLDPTLPDCLPILGYGLYSRRSAKGTPRADVTPDAITPDAESLDAESPAAAAPRVADLPLWALLSKVLLAFAVDYEREPGPSLAISANVLRVLTPGGVRTADIATLAGISSESVAMAMGVLTKVPLVTQGPDPAGGRFKFTRLTARGVAVRDDYPALAADIEAHWRTRFGPDRVTTLRAALEPLTAGDPAPLVAGLAPYPDNWRARVKPAAVLPHYPMTLHRGGYPDGS
jgi:methyltransferase (TIGR00027 family)